MKIQNLFGLVSVFVVGCGGFEMPSESEKSDAFVATDTSQPPDTFVPDNALLDLGQPDTYVVPDLAQTDTTLPDTFVPDQMVEVCVPDCNGKACGDDGCGGVCGQCVADACSKASCTEQGKCEFSQILCDDQETCTIDTCDPIAGCQHKLKSNCCQKAADCDDKNVCTIDACDGAMGKCEHTAISCDDGEVCTYDSCDPKKGCVVSNLDCDDDDPDTLDICVQGTGCSHFYIAECQLDKDCDDKNPCTDDNCEKGKCVESDNTDPCSDSNACTTSDTCKGGACVGGPAPDCDDSDECTNDSCDPAKGCQHTLVTCDDGDSCSTDSCDPDKGCTTKPKDCSDGNVCTTDSCDEIAGCQHTPLTSGGCCAIDGDCAVGQVCIDNICKKKVDCKTVADCDDKDVFTEDICDAAKGCLHYANEFAFSCVVPDDLKAPGRYCQLWIGYGMTDQGQQVDVTLAKEVGVKLGATSVCGSWWWPQVEVNVEVFGPGVESGQWVGGQFAKMADPDGKSVTLHAVKHPWADPDNYGTPIDGIPWCLNNKP